MSNLKYRLREILPRLTEQARKVQDPELKRRLYLVKAVANSPKPVKSICESKGTARETFYRWARRLLVTQELKALASISKRPKTIPRVTSSTTIEFIRNLKKKYSFCGPERISFFLRTEYETICPPSTVYAVLKREGLISKEYRERRTKKHLKRYRRPFPGYLQIDFKYLPYKVERWQWYQLSAVDHCSSWRFIEVYDSKGVKETIDFLDKMKANCPFPIIQIQTDNDVAFTDKFTQRDRVPTGWHLFDRWCRENKIIHRLIPPGEKELNGKVENTHKFDDEEFYSQHQIHLKNELKALIYEYNDYWNKKRATKTLGWKTPSQTVYEKMASLLVCLLVIQAKEKEIPRFLRLQEKQNAEKIRLRTKAEEPISRYLAWMDWEAKQYIKSLSWISMGYSIKSG